MSRAKRIALGGYVYHVLNRANGGLRIFRKDSDLLAFEQILSEGVARVAMRICGYCHGRERTPLSGPVQEFSGAGRRALLDGSALY